MGALSYPAREAICDSSVLRKAGIIRGCFINFHSRDKSALMLAVAKPGESMRRLHPLRTILDDKNSVVQKNNPNIYILKNFIEKFQRDTDNERKKQL